MENLPLLRDIHLPADVSAFPPAYGWFVIAGVLVLAVLFYKLWRYLYLKSKKHYALHLLQNAPDNTLEKARLISEILRRICRLKFKDAVALSGKAWIDFLNEHCSQKIKGRPAELLSYAPYVSENNNFSLADYKAIENYARQWIGENL